MGAEPDEARRIFDRFAEAGGTFLDSADGYQFGEPEKVSGKLISADRDRFVLATKFTAEGRPSDLGMVIHTESTGQKTAVVDTVLMHRLQGGAADRVTALGVPVAWRGERG